MENMENKMGENKVEEAGSVHTVPTSGIPTHEMITPLPENKSSIGAVIGTIIIIALIMLGGLYFWGKRVAELKEAQTSLAEDKMEYSLSNNSLSQEASAIKSISPSDDLTSLEADLRNTNTTTLDTEAIQ